MIKIILLLVFLLMCGCENSIITDEAKYKDNAFKDNKEIEPVSDSIANDINKLLEENNLKAAFKFVKLENVDDNIIGSYSSGIIYTILVWLLIVIYVVFLYYVICTFFRKKK